MFNKFHAFRFVMYALIMTLSYEVFVHRIELTQWAFEYAAMKKCSLHAGYVNPCHFGIFDIGTFLYSLLISTLIPDSHHFVYSRFWLVFCLVIEGIVTAFYFTHSSVYYLMKRFLIKERLSDRS